MSILTLLAVLSLVAWVGVLASRRGFWLCDQRLDKQSATPGLPPEVVVVIPARDEAPTIGETVRSLLNQSYPGKLRMIVVDDNSTDGTAKAARAGAALVSDGPERLTVISGKPLETGWSGKLWALHQGLSAIPDVLPGASYVLFTDADIEHAPGNIARLVSQCERNGLAMASLMVKLRCRSVWERLLIPAFVFFFQKLYPFPQVNDPKSPLAGAAGGCILARRSSLEAIGGIFAIRGALIDDCTLAARLKETGPIWLGLAGRTRSLRPYDDLWEIWRMVARTAYVQLRHSPLLLLGSVLGMILIYLVPPLAVVLGTIQGDWSALIVGLVVWLGMAVLYRPTLKLYRQSMVMGMLLPIAAFLYTLMTVDSARRHYAGRGGEWKGRAYSAAGHGGNGGETGPETPAVAPEDLDAHVEAITRASGTSFFRAMRILPEERRRAMYAIYAFCRVVDDIADNPGEEAVKRAQLAQWRDEIEALYDEGRKPTLPVAQALDLKIRRFGMRKEDFLAVIDGMETDAGPSVRIKDMDDLELYCDRVACAVGRLSNRVFGVDPALSDDVARHTGLALQLTNILRDVVEDAGRNRLYLPESRLRVHGLNASGDLGHLIGHPATVKVCAELASKAQHEFKEADRVHALCDRKVVRPAILMKEAYRLILEALLVRGWKQLDQPVSISKAAKIWVAIRHGYL
jgi:squalene synthase HpnD